MLENLFKNNDVTNQPIFYLFIAFTILISLGYSWGKRRNKRIYLSAFNDLVDLIKPKDQQFTNIGGLTGYHANLIPKKNDIFRRVDATLTLLPRQSWLYYPFSLLTRRFDRLFLIFFLSPKKKAKWVLKEGHLIERKYSRFRGPKIENEDKLQHEDFMWGGKEYILYYEDNEVRKSLLELANKMGAPGNIKHIAIVPEKERIFLFMIPKLRTVKENLLPVINWINTRKFAHTDVNTNLNPNTGQN